MNSIPGKDKKKYVPRWVQKKEEKKQGEYDALGKDMKIEN